ncbi:MAG: tRNA uridine-5-carboxymethylaminomethyl(34) synthesis GTPase MnmE [Thermodesulfobacteriota bacterium]
MNVNDTIAAIATPPGEGGVGIVRVSGAEALKVAKALFTSTDVFKDIKERHLYYGKVVSLAGETIDDSLMVFFKGPRSFTGEDTVEFQCHGGELILKKVLSALLRAGAREAEPGEFTRQAFVNGKLDLAQAEAVLDIIKAGTNSALASSRGKLEGRFSRVVMAVKEPLVELLARIESELDFSEEEITETPAEEIVKIVNEAEEALKKLVASYLEGRAAIDGVRVLILGRPNVGKSSLLNVLLSEERAIVTPVPGTTRDVIEEIISVNHIPVRLIDTAGLRESTDEAEQIGVRFATERIPEADIVLFVVDATAASFTEDLELFKKVEGKKVIIVANKIDLVGKDEWGEIKKISGDRKLVFISALKKEGITELEATIFELTTGRAPDKGVLLTETLAAVVTSARHKAVFESTLDGLYRVRSALSEGAGRDIVSAELRWSVDRLGEITGETTTEDILDRIFSEFCIGK